MQVLWAEQALVAGAWQNDVRLEIAGGRIARITPNAPAEGLRVGLLAPAPANSHSHAFQRAMAGLTEKRGPAEGDSFWTWRQLMFRFLNDLTPDHVEAITAFVQMEMLEAGFGASVEFHYLHHRPGGAPYRNVAEMSARIAAAAQTSGIGLTLLPVLYMQGGCDGRALAPGQQRFDCDLDLYVRLLDGAGTALARLPADTVLGTAPHSLRAVSRAGLEAVVTLRPDAPIHMHLAEQQAEVDEVQAAYGARPVEWGLAHLELSSRWCLIHCTQMTAEETTALAHTGAVAGLCPLTEASLGDGIFDGLRWVQNGGTISVGSDSNIRISLAEELRQLDTSQRLRDHSRAAFATSEKSTGERLWEGVAQGGAQAAGRGAGQIAQGEWADLLALDMTHVDLAGLRPDTCLDTFVFAGDSGMVKDVWSAGRHMVQDGRHIRHAEITNAYRRAVAELRSGL
ncbi:formimidoylglutamate deiminase [Aestuariivita boseongensis]|uniref:formimidoylglutamate deiminase n=1 Tax=Aestuariivita boseongensis TaxID=1470562 RepID=UPI0006830329|nr:formimidoylglutamate deiminase [Aestuariivita boseongensis]